MLTWPGAVTGGVRMTEESTVGVTLCPGPASLSARFQPGLSAANPDAPTELGPFSPPPYSPEDQGSEVEEPAQHESDRGRQYCMMSLMCRNLKSEIIETVTRMVLIRGWQQANVGPNFQL